MIKVTLTGAYKSGDNCTYTENGHAEFPALPSPFLNDGNSLDEFITLKQGNYHIHSTLYAANERKYLVAFEITPFIESAYQLIGIAEVAERQMVPIALSGLGHFGGQSEDVLLPKIPSTTKEYIMINGGLYIPEKVMYSPDYEKATCFVHYEYGDYFWQVLKLQPPIGLPAFAPFLTKG